ncbi:glycoside hydrolase family 65 protein [Anaerobacillus isosaccharinicus]|uniref:Family 65 glycosyl hydrolase n=1 Tax=Anaerobacillus isosaccharinicus TaxID=1532552 RepID=A0A1S2LJX8_9BACI|nr:glycosyl hydrolase family 65 protein [Anaerobacillus isosaccharinicus]MBA5588343.1 glycoside hydrolase family 65 protein [Anaerobacillus isosaccharinicus]QOY38222.1 glycoside hydrolase family 65 protein [Anaerobacillus isosaccharinicus]
MTWTLSSEKLDQQNIVIDESLFALGNGYLGIRGNFEEGYPEGFKSIRGTYINAFHDITEIQYGEKLFAFPETQQKLLNVIDSQTIEIHIDGEHFSLENGEVVSFERKLHLDRGYSERIIHWKSPNQKEVKLIIRRLVSFSKKELFAIDIQIIPISMINEIKLFSTIEGDVSNYVDKNDPRLASGHAKLLSVIDVRRDENVNIVQNKTETSNLEIACISESIASVEYDCDVTVTNTGIRESLTFPGSERIQFTKLNVYVDTLRHGPAIVEAGLGVIQNARTETFEEMLEAQKQYLDRFWSNADIEIKGDEKLQEGIRFNLFQLLQSVGKDGVSNIAAKGLSGEGYEGHYFWDTEIYILPVFTMTNPQIAKKLLKYRHSILEFAKARAREMGHKQGALFPWRTISGTECSAFFPAGTAQYHISADIAYSYIQYYLVTGDLEFLKEFGAEVLFETARLWIDVGHYYEGTFRIDDVTGPDEYTCIVNNNYYTNAMAKWNLSWAAKVADMINSEQVSKEEAKEWQEAAEKMYLPYDEKVQINPQDDTFLQKAVWDFEATPKEKYPLLLHYHPLTLYRYQVLKQANTVLAHFLLEDEQTLETMKRSYDYYEKITTHDSSLSYCIYSIMAAKLGYKDKAYNYFIETARLDLDNTHGNTKDGLHMANMGGTWLAIVYGFAGMRVKENGISFAPFVPEQWQGYSFFVQYQNQKLKLELTKTDLNITLVEGDELEVTVYDEVFVVQKSAANSIKLR